MRRWRTRVSAVFMLAWALACLMAGPAWAEEATNIDVPETENPYIQAVATLYGQSKYEEAFSKLEKAQDWKSNGPQEQLWLKLMQGVLQVELAPEAALQTFKEALAMDEQAQLPVKKGSRRLRKLFEQARNTAGLPADLALEEEPDEADAPVVTGPPERRMGLSLSVRGEVDVPGLGVTRSISSVVGLGYTKERMGGLVGVLVQPTPGLRAEWQYHPINLGWVRPYAGVGATAFFLEENAEGTNTVFGGVSGRGVLGVDVQWNSRMFVFADVAYERFFTGGERYRSEAVLFSIGVGLFPQHPNPVGAGTNLPR
ncbi:OmpW family outer membrane protein [Hyalangium minutum]|uniref:OmpW family outer membrane protein n=1 Tax=Hyalangium minutum TaxID=394096 RepID=UPI0004E68CA2|nr:OmpW family outer membrane protein [Hyalangium minutum]